MYRRFRATKTFWRNFRSLSPDEKAAAKALYPLFKSNPFDPRLGTHRIDRLSARYKRTVYSICIDDDLRAVFVMGGDEVVTLDIGSHDIYR